MTRTKYVFILLLSFLICPSSANKGFVYANDLQNNKIPISENKNRLNATSPQHISETETPDNIENSKSLFDLFQKGGLFMWPILLFAAISMGFIIERFIFFRRENLGSKEFIKELEDTILNKDMVYVETFCKERNFTLSKIILKGLRFKHQGVDRVEKALSVAGSIQVSSLERGLNVLSALGNIVPMLGFLGTVSGMINAFRDIAAADLVNARIVAGGIEEALLTTASGLIVAIPTLSFYNYFIHKIDGFISDIEKLSSNVLEKLVEDADHED